MATRMTWEEMKRIYTDQWLLIVDYDLDENGHLKIGVVERHSKNKNDIYEPAVSNKSIAFRYTGESNFSGLRSHACQ